MLIAITGKKRAGKDEAARALIEMGYSRIALADPIKEHMLRLNPIVGRDGGQGGSGEYTRYQDAIELFGGSMEKARDAYPEIRRLQQVYGTEVWRAEDDLFWVAIANQKMGESGNWVCTDVRFDNEAIHMDPALVIRIVRPGQDESDTHASEAGVSDHLVGVTIVNDSSIADLHASVRAAVAALVG